MRFYFPSLFLLFMYIIASCVVEVWQHWCNRLVVNALHGQPGLD